MECVGDNHRLLENEGCVVWGRRSVVWKMGTYFVEVASLDGCMGCTKESVVVDGSVCCWDRLE